MKVNKFVHFQKGNFTKITMVILIFYQKSEYLRKSSAQKMFFAIFLSKQARKEMFYWLHLDVACCHFSMILLIFKISSQIRSKIRKFCKKVKFLPYWHEIQKIGKWDPLDLMRSVGYFVQRCFIFRENIYSLWK